MRPGGWPTGRPNAFEPMRTFVPRRILRNPLPSAKALKSAAAAGTAAAAAATTTTTTTTTTDTAAAAAASHH
eukprot:gene12455-biopygen4187